MKEDLNVSGIYSITNITNGKVYIGSAINIGVRWREHLNDLKGDKHHSIKLQRAWNKYGESNFKFEVITTCDIEELITIEQSFIDEGDTYKLGYNCCPVAGSRLGSKQSEETKRKISESLKGRPSHRKGKTLTEETKLKLSKARKGKKLSETHVENIRKSKLGNKNPFYGKTVKEEHKTYKRIKQFTKDGEFIKKWESLTHCANALNTQVKYISNVVCGRRKTHLGFTFTYA